MFASVKKVARPVAAAPSRFTAKAKTVVEGWEEVCALHAVAESFAALAEIRKEAFKQDRLKPIFVAEGERIKGKPESLSPVEGDGRGSTYVAKRSTQSRLSLDELNLIADMIGEAERDEDGIVTSIPGFTDRVEVQPGYLTINPDYMPGGRLHNEEKMRRIEKLLEKEAPDFIVAVEAEHKAVVNETALGMLFQKGGNVVASLFDTLGYIGLRPVWGGTMERAWEIVRPLAPAAAQALIDAKEAEKAKKAAGKGGAPAASTGGKRAKDTLMATLKASLERESLD